MSDEAHPQPPESLPVERHLPQPDDLLARQGILRKAVSDPYDLYVEGKVAAEQQGETLEPATAEAHFTGLRQTAIEQILVPEAKVQLVAGVEKRLSEGVEDGTHRMLGSTKELQQSVAIENGKRGLAEIDDKMPAAEAAIRQLHELTANRLLQQYPHDVERSVAQLSQFSELYYDARRGVEQGAEVKYGERVRLKAAQEDIDAEIAKADRHLELGDDELAKQPASAVNHDVFDAVAERGAASIFEHDVMASDEAQTIHGRIEDVSRLAGQTRDLVEAVADSLAGDYQAVAELPGAEIIGNISYDLQGKMRSLLQQGGDAHSALDALGEFQRQLYYIKSTVTQLRGKEEQDAKQVAEIDETAREIRTVLHV